MNTDNCISDPFAIRVRDVTKTYSLGVQKSGSIREQLIRFFRKSGQNTVKFNALHNLSFDILKGDVVGIIGKNGAGKSTILKVLSQITTPTTGRIEINGRVASLLEVGTGFHPELTGRENIYLNGTILGMTRKEVREKFDEIVAFSGIEKFIDTPVKNYSSGMYVRLAFSVAAHLEPEILIVDEVLAVGDADFQKRCLGKMQDVASGGRTVLFVSHNMAAIQNLCNKTMYLKGGELLEYGKTEEVIPLYLNENSSNITDLLQVIDRKGDGSVLFKKIEWIQNGETVNSVDTFNECYVSIELTNEIDLKETRLDIGFNDAYGTRIAWMSSSIINQMQEKPSNRVLFKIDKLGLAPGQYNCNLFMEKKGVLCDWISYVGSFEVSSLDYYGTGKLVPTGQGNTMIKFSVE